MEINVVDFLRYPFKIRFLNIAENGTLIQMDTVLKPFWCKLTLNVDAGYVFVAMSSNIICAHFLQILVLQIPLMCFAWTKEVIPIFSKDIVPW